MNTVQKNYAMAKAYSETAYEMRKEYEQKWMKEHGRTEKYLFTISKDDDYDRLSSEFDSDETAMQLSKDYYDSIDMLKQAEDALIEYGLSVIPDELSDQIRSGLKLHRIRERFIDITFHLKKKSGKNAIRMQLNNLYRKEKLKK